MRSVCVAAYSLLLSLCMGVLLSLPAFGQGGTGTITGTITDPTGASIPGAMVQAKNVETGVVYTGASTAAGNYSITDLPVGTYELTVMVTGFKTYIHTNLTVAAAQTIRQDIPLQVGAASESVTVEAQATLLKTETGDQTFDLTLTQEDNLPLLGVGTVNAGTSGYRNPYNTLLTLPGVTSYNSSGLFTINGLGGTTTGASPNAFVPSLGETMRIEGQDATSRIFGTYDYTQMAQPNTDAVQEIAVQASNYAPEYGQAGTAVINMVMRSGTNQYHGSAFEYFVNEDLNAADPYTENTSGTGPYRPLNRRNDFGGTLGGPVIIPKLYNGKNKTFFFFAYEQYLEGTAYSFTDTVPTAAMRNGDFSAISANGTCSLCAQYGIPTTPLGTDPLGRPVYANEIYNPTTRGVTSSGLGYANPFPNNVIPASMMSASSLAFLNLLPQPTNGNLVGNYAGYIHGGRYSAIPTFKIDEIITDKDKLSFYWDRNNTESQIGYPLGNADGLPEEIGGYRGTFIPTWIARLNYDRTISPTILLHLGAGYMHTSFSDRAPFLDFNPSQFDLSGFVQDRQFPSITGLCGQLLGPGAPGGCISGTSSYFGQEFSGFGGMQNIGTAGQIQSQNYEEKPSFDANLTWVKGAHTFKFGAELYLEQVYDGAYSGVTLDAVNAQGVPASTAEPFIPTNSYNGYNMGFGFASFLLGDYASSTQTPNEFYRIGNQQWGLFAQDSWKVRRNLTVTYGVRWDYATPEQEQYGRLGQFDPTLSNPSAGGHLGAVAFASTCNCNFYQSAYPFALGPRLGVAYQLTPKTVLRGGWGFTYQYIASPAGMTIGTPGVYPLSGVNPYVNISTPGAIPTPTWPSTYAGVYPIPGTVGVPGVSDPYAPDADENRPPRINQYSFSIQQEITPNLIFQAAYVGNHAVWLGNGPYGTIAGTGENSTETAQISPATYAQFGLYPYPGTGPSGYTSAQNYQDYLLTLQPLNSSAVQQRLAASGHAGFVPYTGFPVTDSLNSALYPYPQYGGILDSNSPTGASKYDSLQLTLNKRFSHGLQAGGSYTWAAGYVEPYRQDFFNPQSAVWELQQIPIQDLNFNAIYTVPQASFIPTKALKWAAKDWQIGWYANYQSGQFLAPPTSPTLNYLPSEDIRVPGQPFYTQGVNINNQSSFSPYYTQVLNPNAWEPCPAGSVCPSTSVYYKGFRGPRTPIEDASIGRNFRFGSEGRFVLFIRAEFVNIFNRTLLPNPTTANPQDPVVRGGTLPSGSSVLTGGFGVIDAYNTPGTYYGVNTAYLQGRTGTLIARFQF
jgi:Carboxypeptidase regulatory-like domain